MILYPYQNRYWPLVKIPLTGRFVILIYSAPPQDTNIIAIETMIPAIPNLFFMIPSVVLNIPNFP